MTECDTLLMVGSGFPYSEFLPKEGAARGVQIDIEPEHAVAALSDGGEPGRRRRRDAAGAAAAAASTRPRRSMARAIDARSRRMVEDARKRAQDRANPVNPQRVTWELSPRLPDGVIVTSDSGSCANWYARDLKIRRGMMASLSGGLASMGAAVPYAIAAKFAHPERPVIALVGDGAMQMNNMAELITVSKYWRQWLDHRWIVCVFNNEDLNQVTWEQRVMEGDPKFDASQDIPNVPYHQFAELIGLKGIYVDDPTPWVRLGTKRWPPTGRLCLTSRPIPKFRRCRRTSPLNRRSSSRKRCARATRRRRRDRRHRAPTRRRAAAWRQGVGWRFRPDAADRRWSAAAYRIPTDRPEADGTFAWNSTTLVVVRVERRRADRTRLHLRGRLRRRADRRRSLAEALDGRTRSTFRACVAGDAASACAISAASGLAATAISAVDAALWDLKAKHARSAARAPARAPRATRCRSTAAAASPPIRTTSCASSFRGWVERTAAAASR